MAEYLGQPFAHGTTVRIVGKKEFKVFHGGLIAMSGLSYEKPGFTQVSHVYTCVLSSEPSIHAGQTSGVCVLFMSS